MMHSRLGNNKVYKGTFFPFVIYVGPLCWDQLFFLYRICHCICYLSVGHNIGCKHEALTLNSSSNPIITFTFFDSSGGVAIHLTTAKPHHHNCQKT